MFYNVENFFPPNQNLNSGLYNWDEYKYRLKVKKISNVFRFIKEDFGIIPPIIGLAEIGARSVLEDLTSENSVLNGYEIIYNESQDSRGLSVALLFDANLIQVENISFLSFELDGNEAKTREILSAEMLYHSQKLQIFVVHLPSKRARDEKRELREHICEQIKILISAYSEQKKSVILMGDFNENPDSKLIKNLTTDHLGNPILSNPFEELWIENKVTTFHGKTGLCFDQIIFSENHFINQYRTLASESNIYDSYKLRNKHHKNSNFPFRTYSGSRYLGGYSDHFPVLLYLRIFHQ